MPRIAVNAPFGDDDQNLPPDDDAAQAFEPQDDRPIEMLDLSVRGYNCLTRSGITTIGHLLALTRAELLAVRNFNQQCRDEAYDRLSAHGIMTAEQPLGPFRP